MSKTRREIFFPGLTDGEAEELEELDRQWLLCSMGDRPTSPAASKILRRLELVRKNEDARR